MRAVLISTYELGHQPFGLASPAAWLRARGISTACFDLARESLREEPVRQADLVAFYVPMHTATRLAAQLVATVRNLNPRAHLCFYGLYAPANETYLRGLGVNTIIGGEFERALADLAAHLGDAADAGKFAGEAGNSVQEAASRPERAGASVPLWQLGRAEFSTPRHEEQPRHTGSESAATLARGAGGSVSLERLEFLVPDRTGLLPLRQYAHLLLPDGGFRVAGYTEASRGCKHFCRHCPVVPVYKGVFRIVPREVVLEDIRRQVAAGAEHITFGDPDFFNGPTHALAIVEMLHGEFPRLSYDVTIKVEHLLRRAAELETLRDTGCLFVTTAVEAVDDAILARLEKGHTRADFLAVAAHFRELGLALQPTFVPFTPWTTLDVYRNLLTVIAGLDLVESVAPIQLGIRLLIPAGSRLLELAGVRRLVGPFDAASLAFPWKHPDPRMDALARHVQNLAAAAERSKLSRSEIFARVCQAAQEAAGEPVPGDGQAADVATPWLPPAMAARPPIPHFTEPWYCCAEPTQDQFISIAADPQLSAQRPDGFV